jgi:hypothetical protein
MGVAEHAATDSKMFAFQGDLVGTQSYLIKLKDDTLNLTPCTTVMDAGIVRGLLAANLQLSVVGPFNNGDANTVTIKTCFVVPIPHKYASLFLAHPGGLSPWFCFETILSVIEADGLVATCKPLPRFCLMAITTPGPGQASAIHIATPLPPSRHVPLLEQAKALLTSHLTGLCRVSAPDVNLQLLINTIIAGQQQHQQEHAVARLDKEIKDKTLVATWLGVENFACLLRYCRVGKEQELSPLWSILARAPAKDCLTIFNGKVANEFLALGAIYKQFAPSLFLLMQVTSLKWGMLNPDALKSGSLGNAFLFTDMDIETAQGLNCQIEFIQQGGATPSYANAQILLKAKINLPGPDDSLRCILWMLAVCRAVLPPAHLLVAFLHNHYAFMKASNPGWVTYSTHVPALRGLKGVYHLQWLSLKIMKFLSQIDHNLGKACCPDPHKIINLIQEQRQ